MKWFLKVMKQYADFNGRARRKEYWMFVLFYMIILIIASILDNTLGLVVAGSTGAIYLISVLIMLVPAIAVAARRMHDVGKSGWYMLIPIYNLILYCTDSETGSNEYGPNPKEGSTINDHLTETTI